MNPQILSIISYLAPFTVAVLGSLNIFGNRHKGISRSLLGISLFIISYKFAYDMLGVLGLDLIQILAFLASMPILFAIAPLLFKYFQSLQVREYELNGSLSRHLMPGVAFLVVAGFLLFLLGQNEFLDVLNHRFKDDPSFEKSAYKIILFIIAAPALAMQWAIYYGYLRNVIDKQKTWYGKFYGSYEKRNETLTKRIFFSFFAVFILSFLVQFFQVNQPFLIILINLVLSFLVYVSINSGREQIDMKNYRMYKLSSHDEEIRNDRTLNEL